MVLPWLAAGWIAGVAAAPSLPLAVWQWLALAAVSAAAALATRRSRNLWLAFACGLSLALGAARAQASLDQLTSAPITHNFGPADVIGRVRRSPSRHADRLVIDLEASSVSFGNASSAPTAGLVRVYADAGAPIHRGQVIAVRGTLLQPQDENRGEASAVMQADSVQGLAPPSPGLIRSLDELRGTILARLHAVLPSAEASLIAGVLLGIEDTMPKDLQEDFRATGTAHILVVSGFNVTIVAAASLAVFRAAFGARPALIGAAIAVLGYTLLAGADPPVVRAALMAGIVLAAARLGRQPHALSALAAAAILMTAATPAVVRDLGFQLSFLATLGLVVAGRPLTVRLREWSEHSVSNEALRPVVFVIAETVLITLVAQIATLPISLYAFGRVPVLALPANALILPIQPPLMAAGAATAIAALVSVPLGRVVAWTAWPFAAFTNRVAEILADVPGSNLSLAAVPWTVPVGMYALLAGLLWVFGGPWRASITGFARRFVGIPLLLALGLLTVGVWKAAAERPDGSLRVTALPAGAVLVETPTGRFLAISAAQSQAALKASLDPHLPLAFPGLDWLVLTNPDASPSEVVSDLGSLAPQGVLHVSRAPATRLDTMDPGLEPEIVDTVPGTRLQLGGGAVLELLDTRSGRWAAGLSMGSARILLIEARPGESLPAALAPRGSSAVILLGSGRRVSAAARAAWDTVLPMIVIACPTPGDPIPDPSDPFAGPPRLITSRNGWIRLDTDGETIAVTAERGD